MKHRALLAIPCALFVVAPAASDLNYDDLIPLDAESLAETGIAQAYEELRPELLSYIPAPAAIHEVTDDNALGYSVSCLGRDYFISGRNDQRESWPRATFALFDIVNRQLEGTPYRFFAVGGGNDLGGMFLTLEQVEDAKKSLPRKTDWPYLPVLEAPWYGQFH